MNSAIFDLFASIIPRKKSSHSSCPIRHRFRSSAGSALLLLFFAFASQPVLSAATATWTASDAFPHRGRWQYFYFNTHANFQIYQSLDFIDATSQTYKTLSSIGDIEISGTTLKPDISATYGALHAARIFNCPYNGSYTITGSVTVNAAGGDGVVVSIKKNGATIYGPSTVTYGAPISPNFTQTAYYDDVLEFIVEPGSTDTNDTVTWNPTVQYSGTISGPPPQPSLLEAGSETTIVDATTYLAKVGHMDGQIVPFGGTGTRKFYVSQGEKVNGVVVGLDTLYSGTDSALVTTVVQNPVTYSNVPSKYIKNIFGTGNITLLWVMGIYEVSSTEVIAFLHGEDRTLDFINNAPYVSQAIAYSNDGGLTFTYCGEVVRPNFPQSNCTGYFQVNAGGSPPVVKDGYVYLLYEDFDSRFARRGTSVARAAIADVIADARNGTVGIWQKYYQGAWSESGLGGNFTRVRAGDMLDAGGGLSSSHLSLSWNSHIKKFVYTAHSWRYKYEGGQWLTYRGVGLTFADDVTNFNGTVQFIAESLQSTTEYWYASNIDTDQILDDQFYVYYGKDPAGNYTNNGAVYRRQVSVPLAALITEQWHATSAWTTVGPGTIEISPGGYLHLRDNGGQTYVNQTSINVPNRYMVAFRMAVNDYTSSGESGGIKVVSAAQNRLMLRCESDGVYALDSSNSWVKKYNATLGNGYHVFQVDVVNDFADVYMDDMTTPIFSYTLQNFAQSQRVTLWTAGSSGDAAEMRVDYFYLFTNPIAEEEWSNLSSWETLGGAVVEISPANQLHVSNASSTVNGVTRTNISIPSAYTLDANITVNSFSTTAGETCGIKAYDGTYRLMLRLESDGVYALDSSGSWTKKYNLAIGTGAREYRVVVNNGVGTVYVDDMSTAKFTMNLHPWTQSDRVELWAKGNGSTAEFRAECLMIY